MHTWTTSSFLTPETAVGPGISDKILASRKPPRLVGGGKAVMGTSPLSGLGGGSEGNFTGENRFAPWNRLAPEDCPSEQLPF